MATITVSDNIKLHYNVDLCMNSADAEYIVLVHGVGMNSSFWSSILPLLQENYHVLSYDTRGHGNSDDIMDISWEALNHDLLTLIEKLNIERFHIIGHGFGGNFVIQFSYQYPELISSQTIISTTCYFPKLITDEAINYRKALAASGNLKMLADFLIPQIVREDHLSYYQQELNDSYLRVHISTYFKCLDLLSDDFLSPQQIGSIQIPTLLLSGELDTLYPQSITSTSALLFQKNHYVVIPNAANAIFIDQPVITADVISRFIAGKIKLSSLVNNHIDLFVSSVNMHVQKLVDTGIEKANTKKMVVDLLHSFLVKVNGIEVLEGWNKRNAKRILIYLLFHPSVTREQICDELFPELPYSKARANLRVYLSHLKQLINRGISYLDTEDNEHIYLTGDYSCDLLEFIEDVNRFLKDTSEEVDIREFKHIFSTKPKAILSGIYDQWAIEVRQTLERMLLKVAEIITNYHINNNEYSEALEAIQSVIHYDESEEKHYKMIIDLHTLTGNEKEAMAWMLRLEQEFICK